MKEAKDIDTLRVLNRSDFIGPVNFENSINVGLGEYAASPANKTNIYGAVNIGFGPITGATVTATTGGSLGAATYYYKIFPFTVDTLVGFPSIEKSVVVGGANNAVTLSWTALTGAVKYRIQRGTSSGSGTGYYEVTTNSYTDTGAAFTGVSAITTGSNDWLKVSGVIYLSANTGSINWYNYTDGLVSGHVAVTSAGEFEMSTGKGVAQGNFLFENSDFLQRVQIETESTPVTIRFTDVGSNLAGKIACATSLTVAVGANPAPSIADFTTTGLTLYPTTNQLVLGTTRTVTITAPTPATSSRTWTIPDISANATFASREATETFTAQKTFNAGIIMATGPANAYDLTNIIYINHATTRARVIRMAGAIATDQMIYSAANVDDIRLATSSGSTITDYFIMAAAAPQITLGNGSAGVNLRINTASSTGANTATMTNSPTTGNPTEWIQVNVNGNTRRIPAWA